MCNDTILASARKRAQVNWSPYLPHFYPFLEMSDGKASPGAPKNTKEAYVVRTKDKKSPRQWVDEKGVPRTNVANVNWLKADKTWKVEWVNPQTRTLAYFGRSKNWHDAVRMREKAQKTEGTRGPGELEFTKDGEAVVACGQCFFQ